VESSARGAMSFWVELRGFEPLTPSMRTRCATGLRYSPWTASQRSKCRVVPALGTVQAVEAPPWRLVSQHPLAAQFGQVRTDSGPVRRRNHEPGRVARKAVGTKQRVRRMPS
jgi:hypothetical protein